VVVQSEPFALGSKQLSFWINCNVQSFASDDPLFLIITTTLGSEFQLQFLEQF